MSDKHHLLDWQDTEAELKLLLPKLREQGFGGVVGNQPEETMVVYIDYDPQSDPPGFPYINHYPSGTMVTWHPEGVQCLNPATGTVEQFDHDQIAWIVTWVSDKPVIL